MPDYIDPGVTRLRNSSSGDETTLLLGISGDLAEFATRVERVGATVKAKVGQATLQVTAPQSVIDDLCEREGLKPIEIEQEDVRRRD